MRQQSTADTTVIIPCYNDGRYISQAINSILNQTVLPEKIIVVDDGSAQETKYVLQQLDHPLIEIIYQENQGVASARNNGIKKATTTYILTLDADDAFEPTFIEKALIAINSKPDIVAVCCYYQKYRNGQPVDDVIKPLGGSCINFLVKNNGHASALFKKVRWSEINGYDTNFKNGYEDWEFWISMLRNEFKMYVIPEVLWRYRIKSISRDQIAMAKYDLELKEQIFDKHEDLYLKHFKKVYLELIWRQKATLQTVSNIKNNRSYKLGNALLAPLRFLKSLLK
ncbi:hypothetical protein A9Q93_03450 [Nonlabens dokdonensis]|uniref:Glycosyltransferase 2-like domain-containing protein n=1 Tax=Nonlabens dokdonensis TaxID=328515 RepID=A0A1Z8B7X2_9FLAO|nr:glycosyltransferase family A protein [Nonlabens dokdonensis]OUS18685.1 hypothetical protein A9Q93_03450 [Nonlabens dokdonensis]